MQFDILPNSSKQWKYSEIRGNGGKNSRVKNNRKWILIDIQFFCDKLKINKKGKLLYRIENIGEKFFCIPT